MVDNSSMLSELAVFEENYPLLCNTISDITDALMECCMKKKVFTTEEDKQISAITAAPEKLQLLLQKITSSLQVNDTRSFYIMLKVMKECGGNGAQTLADHIMSRLKISTDKLLNICSDDMHVKNDEPKGLSLLCFE